MIRKTSTGSGFWCGGATFFLVFLERRQCLKASLSTKLARYATSHSMHALHVENVRWLVLELAVAKLTCPDLQRAVKRNLSFKSIFLYSFAQFSCLRFPSQNSYIFNNTEKYEMQAMRNGLCQLESRFCMQPCTCSCAVCMCCSL